MKNTIITLIVLALVGVGIYFFTKDSSNGSDIGKTENTPARGTQATSTTSAVTVKNKAVSVIGTSVEGRDITAYHFFPAEANTGTTTEVLFIGGIHGGYEWNTALVAFEAMDYLQKNQSVIPKNVKVTVVPVLNPDGLTKVVGTSTRFAASQVPSSQMVQVSGRFNANTVDLNRNFDCDWQSTGTWQNKAVSGGSAAFSEPESQAFKTYIEANKPSAVVVWFSAAGGVYSSSCHNGVSAETGALTRSYAKASGYPAHESFDFYATSGDVTNWLAKNNIPAISVLLTNHTDTEWAKNQAGIEALLKHFGI